MRQLKCMNSAIGGWGEPIPTKLRQTRSASAPKASKCTDTHYPAENQHHHFRTAHSHCPHGTPQLFCIARNRVEFGEALRVHQLKDFCLYNATLPTTNTFVPKRLALQNSSILTKGDNANHIKDQTRIYIADAWMGLFSG